MLTISRSISKEKQLSEFEKGQIDILKRQGLNLCQISGIIGRSRCVCQNYIKMQINMVKITVIQKNQNYSREQRCLFVVGLPIK